jgi:aspartyl-tRNA(Asn)/glutamyl-tRNA(Gln) amidotransferase subunit B
LPKNFQITQLNADGYGNTSIGWEGKVTVDNKEIRIRRIQLEEDPGRLIYEGATERTKVTLVDYNRTGTPLVEIVTEPDFENPHHVRNFLNILSDLLENLDVSDPGLDGAMRADANVSIEGGSKVEIKNIGSFHDLEKAVHFEITRQQSLAEREIKIIQETRHWDDRRKITVSARTKEEEEEYRYHLEADIPWVNIGSNIADQLQLQMPENISSKKERYISKYNITPQVADILASDKYFSELFEKANNETNARDIANMITTDLMGLIDTREKREQSKLEPKHLSDLIECVKSNKITRVSAKFALEEIVKTGKTLPQIINELDLGHVSDESALTNIIDEILKQETKAVEETKQNPATINFLVGKVMQKTHGKADPELTLNILKKNLGLK